MKRLFWRGAGPFAFILIAINPVWSWAGGIFYSTSSTVSTCPAPEELTPLHLYGQWRAEFEGLAPAATLQLERHPQWDDSLSGIVQRSGLVGRISAEIENGEFTLEESHDGEHIHATWEGRVENNSCGKEIRGLWRDPQSGRAYPFILRKLPGWN